MSEVKVARGRGRPPREGEIVLIRGRVPAGHPLAGVLTGLTPSRAAMLSLEMASNRFCLAAQTANSLDLIPARAGADSVQVEDKPAQVIDFDPDMAALLEFGGASNV